MQNKTRTWFIIGLIIVLLFGGYVGYELSRTSPKGGAFDQQVQTNFSASTGLIISTSTGIGSIVGTTTVQTSVNNPDITLTILTGSNPAANQGIATVTTPFSCPNGTIPVFAPANPVAAALTAGASIWMASSTATTSTNVFAIKSGTSGLTSTTTYIWDIHVGCY